MAEHKWAGLRAKILPANGDPLTSGSSMTVRLDRLSLNTADATLAEDSTTIWLQKEGPWRLTAALKLTGDTDALSEVELHTLINWDKYSTIDSSLISFQTISIADIISVPRGGAAVGLQISSVVGMVALRGGYVILEQA